VPALPWFSNKKLLREAMYGKLPEDVRTRPKAPLAGDPIHLYADWVHRNDAPGPQLARYVDRNQIVRLLPKSGSSKGAALEIRLIALNHWLHRYGLEPMT
jgi:hypothetical protein